MCDDQGAGKPGENLGLVVYFQVSVSNSSESRSIVLSGNSSEGERGGGRDGACMTDGVGIGKTIRRYAF